VDAVLLQTDTNGDANFRDSKIQLNGAITSPVIIQNNENSTTAFMLQNAAGGQVLAVDTTDNNNLLTNPSFEVNASGWTTRVPGGTVTITRDTTQQQYGLASLRVVASGIANQGVQQTLANPIAVGTAVTLSFSVRLSAGAFGAGTLVGGYANGGGDTNCVLAPAISATVPTTTGWTRFSCTFTVATTPATAIYFRQTDAVSRTYFVDAIQLEVGSVSTNYGLGRISFSGDFVTPINYRNQSDSTTAFTIQRSAGSTLFNVDTLNSLATLTGGFTQTGGAVNITSNAASTWQTSSGLLTITGAGGATITGSTGVLTLGNTTLTGLGVNLIGPNYTTSTRGISIGTSDANITLLNLDVSTGTTAEVGGNCSTAINPGGIYYSSGVSGNNTTNAIRGCINGRFQDVISSEQLGVMLLGVVPDSGSNPGVMGSNSVGPCKVSWASTTSVSVAPCIAYSGGRKVVVTAATTVSSLNGANLFYHICLSGTSGVPTATVGNAVETANVPTYSATAPILCIADVRTGAGSTITNIYDTRTFTTTTKQFITTTAAASYSAGMIVRLAASNGVGTTTTPADTPIIGVVAVGNSAGTAASQLIIATAGYGFIKSTGTVTVGQTAQSSATAGYAQSAASVAGYREAGLIVDGVSSTCTASSDCQYSMLVNLNVK
jgi:hypothetical protein